MWKFYKYQGAGNDFLIADNRDGLISENNGVLVCRDFQGNIAEIKISDICDRRYGIGADGLMLLESSDEYDFHMEYFNSDGSGGMMCGNGGRCMVAFAADMGIKHFDFDAADGFHTAQIMHDGGNSKVIRLQMKNVSEVASYDRLASLDIVSEGWFLDTGTRHYVRFVDSLDSYDIVSEGRTIRYAEELGPIGANVNFVEPYDGGIKVRTYEKGVEDETFACGTGIVASAIASYVKGVIPSAVQSDGRVRYDVKAKRDFLSVDFVPQDTDALLFSEVWLTGPAVRLAEILLSDI
jgi:diaminopimelate epimerase